ncbi:MAG: LptF/LptG family permease [Candidatus Omnitrophota bacterium]
MRILDRYIIHSVIRIFFATIFIFCFLYILIDVASNLNEIIDRKVPFEILLQYYLSFLPIILVQTSPIACLIASILTFSHLNNNNEIIVLRTGGLSFWQITKPAIYFALIVSAGIFVLNERFVPTATASSEAIRNENIILKVDSEQRKKAKIKNLTFYGLKNRLYFIDTFDPNDWTLEGITIIGHDNDQRMREKVVALKGKWTGIAWKFYKCQLTTFDASGMNIVEETKYFEDKLMDIKETPQDFVRQRLDVSSMNIRQLDEYIKRFSHSGASKALHNLRVDMHQKIAFPFYNIVILLVGLPLSLTTGRRKALTFTSLGIGIGIGFIFYVVNAVGLALGKGGVLFPVLSAWLSPIIFLIIAAYLIRTKF